MNSPTLPTPYQLCRIAAAIRGKDIAKNPKAAVKQALNLWSAAEVEISQVRAKNEANENAISSEEWKAKQAELKSNPDSIELILSAPQINNEAEALAWVNAQLSKRRRAEFKTIVGFKNAFSRFAGVRLGIPPEIPNDLYVLDRFVVDRVEKYRARERVNKKKQRQKARAVTPRREISIKDINSQPVGKTSTS